MKKTVLIALATLTLLGGLLLGAKMIQIKGSDTMVNLVQILAEEYMAKNPGTPIAVLGGGSGTGITGLINQTCDVANSSREWKPKEIDQAWEKGVTPKPFVVAVDGLSIVLPLFAGSIDFSPMVAILVLLFLQRFVVRSLFDLALRMP